MHDEQDNSQGVALPITSYAVLGLLSFGEELSGYEVKKWADWSVGLFYWSPSFSQVYSQLTRLESLGYVRSRLAVSHSSRDRRFYTITPSGVSAVQNWAREAPLDPMVLKHSLMMRIWLGHLNEPARLEVLLNEHRSRMAELAESADTHQEGMAGGEWSYADLALRWSRRYYESEIALADDLLKDLRSLAHEGAAGGSEPGSEDLASSRDD